MGKEWEGRGGVTGRQWTEVSRRAAASVSRYLHICISAYYACMRHCCKHTERGRGPLSFRDEYRSLSRKKAQRVGGWKMEE
eukprot:scaffold16003_cov166-Isochrysis_galbana.AAC.1